MSDMVIEKATFTAKSGSPIPVHFNPVSLQYSVANTLAQQGKGKKQYVSQSTAKLTMDLVFDTTDTGKDVRIHTSQIAKLMEPGGKDGDEERTVPEIVTFEWGSFSFPGMVESYKETLDFFAPEGVPLRASVNITLSRQDKVFEPDPKMGSKSHEPAIAALGAGQDAGSAAAAAGASNPAAAARQIGALNGLASLRVGGGAIALSGSVTLGGGAGVSAGAGASANAAIGGSLSVGSSASAGVTASAGAFAGLRTSVSSSAGAALKLDATALQPKLPSTGIAAGAGAQFGLGGQAQAGASAGMSANVGASASLRSSLQFD